MSVLAQGGRSDRQRSQCVAYARLFVPVAQWIEQPPSKRLVARSIRARGTHGC